MDEFVCVITATIHVDVGHDESILLGPNKVMILFVSIGVHSWFTIS